MAVFDRLSRYVKPRLTPYRATDARGRQVNVLPMIEPPVETSIGRHVKKQQQRLDHLANAYLKDPYAFWRFAEVNGAILPDALAERELLDVPAPTR
jgi:transcription termination factor NusB